MSLFTEHAKTIRRMFYRLQYQGLVEDHLPRDLKVLNKVIQEYELEKWIEFDPEDESTWPDHNQNCLLKIDKRSRGKKSKMCIGSFTRSDKTFAYVMGNITHWQPLPTPPSEVEV